MNNCADMNNLLTGSFLTNVEQAELKHFIKVSIKLIKNVFFFHVLYPWMVIYFTLLKMSFREFRDM